MSEEETSHLKAEIARLNKIINVLLEKLDTIKASYSHVRLPFETNNPVDRQTDTDSGINTPIHHHTGAESGMNTPIHPHSRTDLGMNTPIYSHTQPYLGVTTAIHSQQGTDSGINKPLHPNTRATLPLNTISQSNTRQGMPPQQQIVVLPEQIIPSNTLLASVAQKLEAAGYTRVKKDTRQTAAQLMIHFHNEGSSDYAGLQQLTGYSAGGLAKLLITLRKRGFLKRTGHGKYGITENGKSILAQALGG